MSARLRIQALLRRGFSKASIARATGVSLRSVKRIAKEPELDRTSDAEERRRRGIGRPSIVRGYKQLVVDSLREDPRMTSAEILRRARARGYPGGKSALYALISTLRSEPVTPDVMVDRRAASVVARAVDRAASAHPDPDALG